MLKLEDPCVILGSFTASQRGRRSNHYIVNYDPLKYSSDPSKLCCGLEAKSAS